MQPAKKSDWAKPTLYFSPHTSPHSDTVDRPDPPTHSHEPGSNPQTVSARGEQPGPAWAVHRQAGSRSAKIMTMVWKASSAHAKLVRTKWRNCHRPNSPVNLWSISSTPIFSLSLNCLVRRGDERSASPPWSDAGDIFYCSSSSPVVVPIDPQGRPRLCVFLSLFEDLEIDPEYTFWEVADGRPFIKGRVLILDQVQCLFRIF